MQFKHAAAVRAGLAVFGLSTALFVSAGLLGTLTALFGARAVIGVVLLAGVLFTGCRLGRSLRPRREPRLTRPAPVRLPDPVTTQSSPARTAA